MNIIVSEEIKTVCPQFIGVAVEAEVTNLPYSEELWNEIQAFRNDYCKRFTTETIKDMSAITATRAVYKKCGKDPSRYRPSGEALVRRMLKGLDLYQVNTIVDLINLASIAFGYSIGGFDADKIVGNTLILGIGKANEPYEGIGRGPLNIEGLPVYRDTTGGIGTPTSDHERTKLNTSTTRLLALVNGYDGNKDNVSACAEFIRELLRKYALSDGGTIHYF